MEKNAGKHFYRFSYPGAWVRYKKILYSSTLLTDYFIKVMSKESWNNTHQRQHIQLAQINPMNTCNG
jgi:hypothetical protein